MSSSNTSNTVINPKPCNYGCSTRIYWDTSSNSYLEVFTKKKHICPNRSSNNKRYSSSNAELGSYSNKSNYYNKFSKQPKPKMANSLELLTGRIDSIQEKYEILSDIVSEFNGKVHGSQSHTNGNLVSLIVYYEVPECQREEVKKKFTHLVKNH